MSHKVLRLPAVIEKTGLSRSTIYNYVALGKLDPPIKLTCNCVGWLEESIDLWIEQRIKASLKT